MSASPRVSPIAPLIERFRCPRCAQPVDTDDGGRTLACPSGHRYGFPQGYLDVSVEQSTNAITEQTFASFGYEWNAFDEIRDEDVRFGEIYFRDLDLASLDGKVGMDAGCGKGRFTRFLAPHLDALVALDGSSAVEAAVRNLGEFPNVMVVKSDLRAAPFAPESFDFISCLGVLHHLDDPHAGFEQLVRYLAPGGTLLAYIYSRPDTFGARKAALSASAALRRLTLRLPHRTLKAVSPVVAAGLYAAFVGPGRLADKRGIERLSNLPMRTYRDKPFRSLVLDTFDRLSAPVEHRYIWSELEWWFTEAGLTVDAARDEAGWFIVAHRP
ncbi:MAG TPA: class I SAM-dependent methyltransferase [Acidimicrobiales bacterium]|nr:class I SAM-dependent methyltransferase [Acidimicrobiales bacterium]